MAGYISGVAGFRTMATFLQRFSSATDYRLKNADFTRKCNRRGQVKMAAVAYNLKRWHKMMLDDKKAQRYRPPVTMVIDDT